jgi:hypothetical protein
MHRRLDQDTANSAFFRRKVYEARWQETLVGFKYLTVRFLRSVGLATLANDLFGFDEWMYNKTLDRVSRFWDKNRSV